MSALAIYTLIHVAISLVGIVSGFGFAYSLVSSRPHPAWTATFFISTLLTSVTGFGFPHLQLTPGVIIGILSLIVLATAAIARYVGHLRSGWRITYVVSALVAFYFNFFVLVVQSFMKIPALHALAPTNSEPPFAIAQLVVLVAFLVVGYFAVRRFHETPTIPTTPVTPVV
ncbi:hypothetical protein M4951_19765 [Blastopirellula sp. J2-11]|uniref:hypothetical protein n=1 Tax=Blastopirellula sp. J2-11 TaxID=2943192 RepID=UPI0021C9BF33|nr:hypothetical protein [Blastopirellula sp. J2-11]UUO05600.1 hypothetical protein M4951_19765 [Blastopirellula sp. J2-11]